MKRVILITLLILINCLCFAQAPSIQWQKCYGGTGVDYPLAIKSTTDGGYVTTGFTSSISGDVSGSHGGGDFWVLKLAANGSIEWQKALGGSNRDFAYSIVETLDGGYILTGDTLSTNGDVTGNHGQGDVWVVKLDSNGNIQWQKTFGGSNSDIAREIQQTRDGGYIFIGFTNSIDGDITTSPQGTDIWVVKMDSLGNIQWQTTFGGTSNEDGYSIVQANSGYIIAGLTFSTDGDMVGAHGGIDTFIAKLDETGAVEWKKVFGGSGDDRPYKIGIAKDNAEEFVFVGSSNSADGDIIGNHGGDDYWIVRLDKYGTILWQKSIGDNGTQYARDFCSTNDGGYILNGVTNTVNGAYLDETHNWSFWIVKVDNSGNLQWQKGIGGNQADEGSCIQQTPDGGYIVGGVTQSSDIPGTVYHGFQDFFIAKLDNQLATNSYVNEFVELYPNPVKNLLKIKNNSSLEIDKIVIFEITGKLVFEQSQNTNEIEVENLASGLYIIEVCSGMEKWRGKFVKE